MNETILIRQAGNFEWRNDPDEPAFRWKCLLDSEETNSQGLSCGVLEISPGGVLPLHHHSPQELYIIQKGEGLLLKKEGETQKVGPGDMIYIPDGEQHGIKNISKEPLEFTWIFPTDRWEGIEYFYAQGE